MKNCSFTLLELLIVIAIIGILITILLPSLAKARETARIAVCASQSKQIAYAFVSYTSNNNKRVPYNVSLGGGDEITWDDRLTEYDGREIPYNHIKGWVPHSFNFKLYVCPSDKSPIHSVRHKRSYSLTQGTSAAPSTKRGIVQSTGAPPWSIMITKVSDPGNTIAMTENHQGKNKMGCNSGDTLRIKTFQSNMEESSFWGHQQWRSNYMLLDSSVRYMRAQSTFGEIRSIWGSENQVDTMWDSRK